MTAATPPLETQIQQHLVASGHYDRLSSHLAGLLAKSGWTDSMRQAAAAALARADAPLFETVYAEMEQKGLESVPEEVVRDMVRQIKQYLDGVVEA